jgi:hypothetical protein
MRMLAGALAAPAAWAATLCSELAQDDDFLRRKGNDDHRRLFR